jgi:nucleotide-binding universal stress UspA family protein
MDNVQGTIVVGIDGSNSSEQALHWATDQAVAEHVALTLVHAFVVSAPTYVGPGMLTYAQERDALRDSGRAMLEAAHKEVHDRAPGVVVHEVLRYGAAAEQLVKMSDTAGMVVVGSHGRGPIRSKVLGSASVHLTRHARCPVVVVRPGKVGAVRDGVLVGVDTLPGSQGVLEFAYREASLRQARLTVIHAQWAPASGTLEAVYLPVTPEEREAELTALAEDIAGMAEKYPEVHVTTRIASGPAEEVLVKVGERMDLIVVGSHQAHGLERMLFGSASVAVVEHATCPVAVVPVSAARNGDRALHVV